MNQHYDAIKKAVDYIEVHLKDTIDLGELAGHVGFSKFYFSRLFREITGMNPYDYYRARKVTEAIHYMERTSGKIIDVAFEFGFNSPEVFTRSCLSALGQSPSQIRKQYQEKVFEGIKKLNIDALVQLQAQETITPMEAILPACLIQGTLYSSSSFIDALDFNNPVLTSLMGTDDLLYVLNWQSSENPLVYHHLVGRQIKAEDIDFDHNFDLSKDIIIKQIPEYSYLGFPILKNAAELAHIKDYVYTYYIPDHPNIGTVPFNVQLIRFDDNKSAREGILYIPIQQKTR